MAKKYPDELTNNILCTGCGTCRALCSVQAITMNENNGVYRPVIDSSKCISCRICVDVCPVLDFWERDVEKKKKEKEKTHFDEIFGYYDNLFVTHSLDNNLRYDCSSGGFVTSLLLYLIEVGTIDYVVVANQDTCDFYVHYPRIISNRKDIIHCSGSRYIPISQCSILDEIIEKEGVCAFVGLPCHINGIMKASEKFPELKKKIKFKIALFCGGTSNFYSTKYLLKLLHIKESDVSSIRFRGEGWPGFFKIIKKDDTFKKIPYKNKKAMGGIYSSPLFRPIFCTMCSDPFARLSDVSVGDAWLERFNDDKKGRNIIIVRNKELRNSLKNMSKNKLINLISATSEDVINSNISLINSRYHNLNLKIKYFKKIFRQHYKYENNSKEYYYLFDRFKIFIFLLFRKYIHMLNKKKMIKYLPLSFVLPFSLLNIIERNVFRK